ncbi:hypothetical protein [Clostridium sp. CCUG 7971]|uniref:hypothetical protein n=1 Tax=Clostridium sp. CCUG 7971 TaxID=2811414 RepID=UPI001ABB1BE8|nr:hypothetical protein [Clostridium sp. CCUG 7971]MBO3446500.1 hypothetical protein [Clostridium sp. CCUG 7971]
MKRGLIKIIGICLSMIIMVGVLNYSYEDKIILKDISGDRDAIGDISFVYNPTRSINYNQLQYPIYYNFFNPNHYENSMYVYFIPENNRMIPKLINTLGTVSDDKEIVIDKDGMKTVKLSDNNSNAAYLNNNRKYKELSSNPYIDERNLFEDKNYIGDAYISNDFEDIKNKYIEIERMNKEDNKLERIKIPLNKDSYINNENVFENIYANFMYRDNLYMITRKITDSEDGNRRETLYILKIDIHSKTYELVKELGIKEEEQLSGVKFINKDKIYIEINRNNDGYSYSYFLIYDITKSELNESIEFMSSKSESGYDLFKERIHYYIENDNLKIIVKNKENYISKLVYSLPNLDLINEEKYNFQINYSQDFNDIEGIKRIYYIEGKIITMYQDKFSTSRKDKSGKQYDIVGNKPVDIKIFDTNINEVVYEGEIISSNRNIEDKLSIVRNY